mgnify:FL=1
MKLWNRVRCLFGFHKPHLLPNFHWIYLWDKGSGMHYIYTPCIRCGRLTSKAFYAGLISMADAAVTIAHEKPTADNSNTQTVVEDPPTEGEP